MLGVSLEQSTQERNERAALYTDMLASPLVRTLEAIEITLSSFVDDLSAAHINAHQTLILRDRLLDSLKFAPHLRQLIVLKNEQVIIDTRYQITKPIDLSALNLENNANANYSLGLKLGSLINGRYFPLLELSKNNKNKHSIIPLALEFTSQTGARMKIIAALNPNYIKQLIDSVPAHSRDEIYISELNGASLLPSNSINAHQNTIIEITSRALEQQLNRVQENDPNHFIPQHQLTVQVTDKYPIAITIVTDYLGSFLWWLKEKQSLLLCAPVFILLLFIGAYLIIRDHEKSQQMKAEVNLLSKVVEHTPTLVMITNAKGEIKYVNKSFEQETGYLKKDVVGKNPRIFNSGETSNQDYMAMWQRLAQGETWFGEFHNRRKDGSLYWERASIGPLKNKANKITHFIALKQPIDDEKAAQERLRLASAVFETATEAIMVLDLNSRIEMINPAFERITGYTEQEVIGKAPSILKSGKHSDKFYNRLYAQLSAHGTWEGEIWNRRKNGEIYPEWLTISSRYDQEGKLEGYVSLFSDITRRKEDEAVILRQANYDAVTSLPNRNLFHDRLNQALAMSDRNRSKTALLFIDLDRFKPINDTYGHHIGDLLLQQVAKRLGAEIRKTDTVARLGGDEFAIILANLQRPYVVERIAEQILASLAEPFCLKGHTVEISCSIGSAFYPDHSTDPETLIIHADSAMYKAKQSGRNTHQYYDPILSPEYQPDPSVQDKINKTVPIA